MEMEKNNLKCHMFSARDKIAMTIKFLFSKAEMKDLHVQFGAAASLYYYCIQLGQNAIVKVLINNPKAKVFWN